MNNKRPTTKEEIEKFFKDLKQLNREPRLSDFYGKLQGFFGDGLEYQKNIRKEWDR